MCGIYGIIYKTKQTTNYQEIIKDTYTGLQQLVHRGKDGFGFSWVTTHGKFYESKKFGELTRFQYSEIITYPMTQIQSCIGHTRYSTSGNSLNVKELQPLYSRIGNFQLIHNGNIPKISGHDTLWIIARIESYLQKGYSLSDSLIQFMNKVPAAFCLILQTTDKLYICRDRYGIRPLCIAETADSFIVSSETIALPDSVTTCKQVLPGEIICCHETLSTIYLYTNPSPIHSQLCL